MLPTYNEFPFIVKVKPVWNKTFPVTYKLSFNITVNELLLNVKVLDQVTPFDVILLVFTIDNPKEPDCV